MNRKIGALGVLFLLLLVPLGQVNASSGGKFNSSNGCGCHGGAGGVTAQLTGLPTAYEALATYTLSVSMSTSPNIGGFNLDVNRGTLGNGDANTQVASNGRQATHNDVPGTASWTMDWTAPASGSGSVLFKLAVLSGNWNNGTSGDDYNTFSTSISEEVSSNTEPVASDVHITPSTPDTTDDLTVSYTYADDDGDGESGTTIAWYKDGAVESSHTTFTLPASATTKGDMWHAVITPSDGQDAGVAVASPTVTVLNRAPDVLNLAVSDERPDTNDDITVSFQTSDADGDAAAFTELRWMLYGAQVESLDNATTLPAIATRVGDEWTVEVRASDGIDTGEWTSSANIVVGSSNQGPVVSDLVIAPSTPTTEDNLTASWTATDPEGDDIAETMLTWWLDGEHVPAADGLNPLPSSFTQRGDAWSVEVEANDGQTWSAPNSATVSIENAAPSVEALLTSPSFSALHNLTISANMTDADGDQPTLQGVAWYRNDALEPVYTADVLPASTLTRGDHWYAVLTVSDGSDQTEFTTPSVLIVNAQPQVAVSWPENPSSLTDLAPTITTEDADGDAVQFSTTWYKNGFRDAGLTNTTVVPADRLAPEQAWRLVVVAHDGTEASSEHDASITLVNLAPSAAIQGLTVDVWYNETTVLTGSPSTDPDGVIVRYDWSWEGGSATGERLEVVLKDDAIVMLTVTDDHGATHQTNVSLEIEIGPDVRSLQSFSDDRGNVRLSWAWTGEQVSFNILRNGEVIGTTNATSFEDQPPISGTVTYIVQPVDEERTYLGASDSISPVLSPAPPEEPGPSAGLGIGLGVILVLALLVLPVLGQRGGGRP
ncbi:MAG: choice-of-anchor V domain-containing protein [Candidatus Poseidoniales archaeon]